MHSSLYYVKSDVLQEVMQAEIKNKLLLLESLVESQQAVRVLPSAGFSGTGKSFYYKDMLVGFIQIYENDPDFHRVEVYVEEMASLQT